MTRRTRKLADKNSVRDCMTGKRIGNKEVVIVDNALDYVKKQGYIVLKPEYNELMYGFIAFVIVLLFLVPVHADIDFGSGKHAINTSKITKTYDSSRQEVTLKYRVLAVDRTILRFRLLTPLDNKVFHGKDRVVAIFELELPYTSDKNIFDRLSLYSINKHISLNRDYTLQKAVNNGKIMVTRYKESNCIQNITGIFCQSLPYSSIEDNITWSSVSGITGGNNTYRIVTDVLPDDKVEWIPFVFNDYPIDDFAVWTSDFNTNLIAYYSFNETSGNKVQERVFSVMNGTTQNGPGWVTGKIGNSLNLTSGNSQWVDFGYPQGLKPSTPSFSFWFNTSTVSDGILWRSRGYAWTVYTTNGNIYSGISSNVYNVASLTSSGTNYANSQWHHYVVTTNLTNFTVWIDGVRVGIGPFSGGMKYSDDKVTIAQDGSVGSGYWTGQIDELGVWNSSLTEDQVISLYNSGAGLSWVRSGVDAEYPLFANYSDTNGTLENSGIAQFSLNVIRTNGTVFLGINGTNYTASNVGTNFSVSVLLNGNGTYPYYWGAWGNGTSANYNISSTRYYTVKYLDVLYPTFSNYRDNSNTLTGQGIAIFNVSVSNSNGTVFINVNGSNYLANNLGSNIYNFSIFLTNATAYSFNYSWFSYGSGLSNHYNSSGNRTFYIMVEQSGTSDIFFSLDMTTLTGIITFIIILAVSILILLYVYRPLGCILLIFSGFIALVSLSNKMLGIFIIVGAVALAFEK